MNFNNDEEALDFFNRLLEQLHQAGPKNLGVRIQIVLEPEAYPAPNPAPQRGGEQEERMRRCITLLMAERLGDGPLFCQQSHWQAVYRILVDKGYCRDSDFDGFDTFIRRVMPDEVNKPYKKDSVKQISQTDFVRPFDEWAFDMQTSKTRRPFDRMVTIARRFREILEENEL